jgi:hypothetical protein
MAIPVLSTDTKTRQPASPELAGIVRDYADAELEEAAQHSWDMSTAIMQLGDRAIARAAKAFESGDTQSFSFAVDTLNNSRYSIAKLQQMGRLAQTEQTSRRFLSR